MDKSYLKKRESLAKHPLLILPTPDPIATSGHGGGGNLRFPTKQRQISNYGPVFTRLRQALGRTSGAIELRDDPSSLAPDRVIVFEIASTITDFFKAVARVAGLEFMAEYEADFAPDENFAIKDTRKGKTGEYRTDKTIGGRFYLAMPDVQAFRQLLSLWDRWERNVPLETGFAPFEHLVAQLHALRPWGPLDRIPEETVRFWQEESDRTPDRPVRTEVELWFHQSPERRRRSSEDFAALVTATGGAVVHEVIIPEIAYHGALIDIPVGDISSLIERRAVRLALADEVMFLRPQSLLISPSEAEPIEDASLQEQSGASSAEHPIAALLDGVPIPLHTLLSNRLILDDPDDLQGRAVVSRRLHGTAMASLILHGDLNAQELPLGRPLYVRPLMLAPQNESEQTDRDRLLIDTIHRAVLRIKGSEGEEAAEPTVFLVNLSMGDMRRPFTRMVSPLARLIDFLSEQYGMCSL